MNRLKWEIIIVLGMTSLIVISMLGCQNQYSGKHAPRITKGVLDLREWDLDEDGPVKFTGEWEFFWKRFLTSEDFSKVPLPERTGFISVNQSWNGYEVDGGALEGDGYATYRLTVMLNDPKKIIALHIYEILTAYTVYINGEKITSVGGVGKTPETSRPWKQPVVVELLPEAHMEIILHVSNFHQNSGGARYGIIFGTAKDIHKQRERNLVTEQFIFGSIFIMGLYHLGLFALRRKDKSPFYFAVICLLFALRTICQGEVYLIHLFPGMSWEWLYKLEYFTATLGLPLFGLFLNVLFPREFSNRILRVIILLSLIFSTIGLLFPAKFYSRIFWMFQIIAMSGGWYGFYVLILAYFRKQEGAAVIIFGILILCLSLVNDVLSHWEVIHTAYLLSYGLFIFLFSQAFFLSLRFSNAFTNEEYLSQELEKRNIRLLELDKLKNDFLANTSHELRTPLYGINGLAESLIDGAAGSLNEKAREILGMIASSGRRLSSLVNDILDFSRLKNKDIRLSLGPVDLRSLADLVLTLSRPLVSGKNLILINDIPEDLPAGSVDEDRVQQILHNIVGNAIKFTEKGEVRISSQLKGNFVEIAISDTGIGIPEDKLGTVFLSFEQADSSTERVYGGTGLGLAVTKNLVELHGGTIWVESTSGRGSVFYFTLPVSTSSKPLKKSIAMDKVATLNPDTLPKPELLTDLQVTTNGIETNLPEEGEVLLSPGMEDVMVLVVDDEPVNLLVAENNLQLMGMKTEAVRFGYEALDRIEARKPDIVLLDVMMPKLNGFETAMKIREQFGPQELPIIFLTAKNQISDLVQGFNAGGNDYLTKPFSKNELLARMKTHVSLSRINQSFSRFVPSEFLAYLQKDSITEVDLGDSVRTDLTIVFSDIRAYTALSESMSPRENFDFLNAYLERVSPIIRHNNGFVNQYYGDGIMALFPSEADAALTASIEMQKTVQTYNIDRMKRGRRPIKIGIGLHTGSLMLGIIGEKQRMDSGVVSDAVNLAAHMESLTKTYGASILISESTFSQLKDPERYHYRLLGQAQVKGKIEKVSLFEIFDSDPTDIQKIKMDTRDLFEKGINLYLGKEFKASLECFQRIIQKNKDDMATSYFISRCQYHIKHQGS